MSVRGVAVFLLTLTLPPCLHADPSTSAPSLGTKEFTVHFRGTLFDALAELQRLSGCIFSIDDIPGARPAGEPLSLAHVELDFDGATLGKILLSICKQVGGVYRMSGDSPEVPEYIWMNPGDPDLDARPTAVLDGYLVRVVFVTATRTQDTAFPWGEALPEFRDPERGLDVVVEVVPQSAQAGLALAGLDVYARAHPDVGAPLERPNARPGEYFGLQQDDPGDPGRTHLEVWVLPAADQTATSLRQLESALILYSWARKTEIRIPAGSEGKSFTADDVTVTVTKWHVENGSVKIGIDAAMPALPQDAPLAKRARAWMAAAFPGADGKDHQALGVRFDPQRQHFVYPMSFTPPRAAAPTGGAQPTIVEPDHVLLTFYRSGPPSVRVPFVLENIALPCLPDPPPSAATEGARSSHRPMSATGGRG